MRLWFYATLLGQCECFLRPNNNRNRMVLHDSGPMYFATQHDHFVCCIYGGFRVVRVICASKTRDLYIETATTPNVQYCVKGICFVP